MSGGVPGVQSNVPPGTEQEPTPTSSNATQTKNETVNYEISRTVSRIVEPIGSIKKLSVAVLVDGTYETPKAAGDAADKPAGEVVKKYIPRSEEDLKRIEDIVKKAMGYSSERQDQVQVVNVQFGFGPEEPVTASVEAAAETTQPWMPYMRYAVGALLFLMILFFVVRPLIAMLGVSTLEPAAATEAATPALPASISAVEASLASFGRQ